MKRYRKNAITALLTALLCLSLLPVSHLFGAQAASVLIYLQAQPDESTLFFQSSDGIYTQPLAESYLSRPGNSTPKLLFPYDSRLLNILSPDGHPLSADSVLFVRHHHPALLDADNRCVWQYDGSTFVLSVETEEIGQLPMLSTPVVCDEDQNTLWFL